MLVAFRCPQCDVNHGLCCVPPRPRVNEHEPDAGVSEIVAVAKAITAHFMGRAKPSNDLGSPTPGQCLPIVNRGAIPAHSEPTCCPFDCRAASFWLPAIH